ncbi:alpha-ketoacid dehydrogenase subunit beta [Mycolicibacterium sp. P9-22]|uniref:alpha-ketoacid dehydrogenase subunit beta n=1 Tax=Mycolicibacterium sp. P9-22 TaxID=2024613 RepID=UPI0011EFF42A|nr:transketolase C-terminal domain-containing protein [Mycolicibacterium sp. P9-22]KAA0120623.1 alpha-ketoacid dehydrogenase subunit beta [Mycolicibacterium sp. P9-22]
MNFLQASSDAFDVALSSDPTVFLLGEDIADPVGGVTKLTKGLSTKFGLDRVRPTPISEQAIIGAAIGAGLAGMRPVAEIMLMDFLGVCLDQLANHAAKLRYMTGGRTNVPITVRTMVGGGSGNGAQHSQSLESWLVNVPGIKVVCASNPADGKGLLLSSIFDDDPCVVMEMSRVIFHKQKVDVPLGDYRVPIGKARVARSGSDITIVSWGRVVNDALLAADELAAEGIDVEIIDLRTLVPLDMETVLTSVAKTRRACVAHAAVEFGGFGAEIAAQITEHLFGELTAPVLRLGAPYAPTPAGPLEASYVPSAARIVAAVRNSVN